MTFRNCTPMPAVRDVAHASDWFAKHLGFAVGSLMPGEYAFIYRDNAAIRLLRAGDNVDLDHIQAQQVIYIDVDDVDAVYAAHQAAIEKLPESARRAPFDTYYGQREFHLHYHNLLIMVGMGLPEEPAA